MSSDAPVRFFEICEKLAKGITKNPHRAMNAPRSTVNRLWSRMEVALEDELGESGLKALLTSVDEESYTQYLQEVAEESRASLESDDVGRSLLELYDGADSSGPLSPILLLGGDIREEMVEAVEVAGAFREVDKSRGERRARALLKVAPLMIEKVLGPVLRGLWGMSYLADGRWPASPPGRLGALVNQLRDQLRDYPELLFEDIARIRNAIQHHDAVYLPETRRIRFRDTRPERTLEMSSTEFRELLLDLWHLIDIVRRDLRMLSGATVYLRAGVARMMPLLAPAFDGSEEAKNALEALDIDGALLSEMIREEPPEDLNLWFVPRQD